MSADIFRILLYSDTDYRETIDYNNLLSQVYCCCCRHNKKKLLDEEVVVGHAVYYPSLKPELAKAIQVQPDSPIPIFTATGVTTPVLAQPIRIKAKGLLER